MLLLLLLFESLLVLLRQVHLEQRGLYLVDVVPGPEETHDALLSRHAQRLTAHARVGSAVFEELKVALNNLGLYCTIAAVALAVGEDDGRSLIVAGGRMIGHGNRDADDGDIFGKRYFFEEGERTVALRLATGNDNWIARAEGPRVSVASLEELFFVCVQGSVGAYGPLTPADVHVNVGVHAVVAASFVVAFVTLASWCLLVFVLYCFACLRLAGRSNFVRREG